MVGKVIVISVLFVALAIGVIALGGLVVWALWNALVPSLAGGPSVTYLQGVLISLALGVIGNLLGRGAR